ncbi:MAG: hypothetical protein H8D34_23355 [Chloroflexi bacterium]|nr:hypothetical protein [Chloroflexota bacterium]
MAREAFIDARFRQDSLDRITLVNEILAEYEAEGYDLSLRQLYYQLVARDHIENSQKSYKRLGALLTKARKAGLIDWNMISDRNRATVKNAHWDSPAEIVEAAARQFAIDKWAEQPCHIEVMVEKDALSGVLEPVCRKLDVRFTANKGYPSASLLYEMGKRLSFFGSVVMKDIYIFQLGDHDPSGVDMTRDLREQLSMFAREDVEVIRLALNMEQIETFNPPENPAKQTDSRYKKYKERFGTASWELDAIEPRNLAALVTDAVTTLRDETAWEKAIELETSMRDDLNHFVRTYKANGGNGAYA